MCDASSLSGLWAARWRALKRKIGDKTAPRTKKKKEEMNPRNEVIVTSAAKPPCVNPPSSFFVTRPDESNLLESMTTQRSEASHSKKGSTIATYMSPSVPERSS